MATIGVLALQGDFREHREVIERLGGTAPEVRHSQDLAGLDGLIIPGGESTAIVRLMASSHLLEPLRELAGGGFPVWGTCAGMILLAKRLDATGIPALEAMDITVRRNAFGRQVDSFETDIAIDEVPGPPVHAVFIRAPLVREAGPAVKVLGRLEGQGIVAARQGHLLVTAFHPELTDDTRLHSYFLSLASPSTGSGRSAVK